MFVVLHHYSFLTRRYTSIITAKKKWGSCPKKVIDNNNAYRHVNKTSHFHTSSRNNNKHPVPIHNNNNRKAIIHQCFSSFSSSSDSTNNSTKKKKRSSAFDPYVYPFDEKGETTTTTTTTTTRTDNQEDANHDHTTQPPAETTKEPTRIVNERQPISTPTQKSPSRNKRSDDPTNPPITEYVHRILNARVYDAAIETDLLYAKTLSSSLKNTVLLKREDTQPGFSFKIRGVYNKMIQLPQQQLLEYGIVACSRGNHSKAVALASKLLNCRAIIVMPLSTPSIKVNAVRTYGGPTVEVRLFGNNHEEATDEAKRIQDEEHRTLIHPFDDIDMIAGNGTIGMEIIKSCASRPLDIIFVCCGGGGMLAGIAAYVKQVRPSVKVIGVEAEGAPAMTRSLQQGEIVTLESMNVFADCAAVKRVGEETFRICNQLVDDMITVNIDQICNAIKWSYNDARVILEPAGALAVAGLKKYVEQNHLRDQTFVAITSGANMDFDRLRFVSERADGSEKTLGITIPETPGSFRALYSLIWPRNVTEFTYRYNNPTEANVLISFQPVINIENDFESTMDTLKDHGYQCID